MDTREIDAPQWRDRPTVPGMWFGKDRNHTVGICWEAEALADASYNHVIGGYRWYGPIPQDTPPAAEKGD